MAKDLRGKELGVGISQRPDGLYTARYTSKNGRRVQKYFKKLQDCRKWIADAQFSEEHENVITADNPTVDAWFEYWIENVKSNTVKNTTINTYKEIYKKHIKNVIGDRLMMDIRPLDCQNVLNLAAESSQSTIDIARIILSQIFEYAVENMLVSKNPITKSVKVSSRKSKKEKEAMTIQEQKIFLNGIRNSVFSAQYRLILQTGLRIGELCGLKWEDIDFSEKTLSVNRTIVEVNGEFFENTPKSKSGKRTIPLTSDALDILKKQKKKTGNTKITDIAWSGFVFVDETGKPYKRNRYQHEICRICKREGLKDFSNHSLRHTFATRCIENGMDPKTLQKILGHATLSMTMDLYVHVTDEQKTKEMMKIEKYLKIM